jgi:hypothetical protein
MCDKVPPLFRAMTAQRLHIAALFIEEYHVDIDCLYAGKNALLLAIDLRYPQAVDLYCNIGPTLAIAATLEVEGPCHLP